MSTNVKAMRAAMHDGVATGVAHSPEPGIANKVTSFLDEALQSERADVAAMCSDASSMASLHAIGMVAAQTLVSPMLKIGELRTAGNVQLAREIARHIVRPDYRLEVAVGLGGSTDPPSLRLLAYLRPLLEFGASFDAAGVKPPPLRVVAAHRVSSAVNGLNPDIAHHRAMQAAQVLARLALQCPDSVRRQLSFEHLDPQELVDHAMVSDAEYIRQLIDHSGPEQALLQKLMRRATSKHAGTTDVDAQKPILAAYVAAHGLSFHNYRYPAVHGNIKLGGQGEAPFDVMQQHMAERALTAGEHVTNRTPNGGTLQVNLRMRAGVIPPYYLESSDELTVETPPELVSHTAAGAAELYAKLGLRSGSDFRLLPREFPIK